MKMKKLMASLLAGAMVLSMCACGQGGSTSTSDAGSTAGTADSGDKIQLTMWHIQTGTVADIIQCSVDRFMADNPEYEVTVVQKQNDSYKTDFLLLSMLVQFQMYLLHGAARHFMIMLMKVS